MRVTLVGLLVGVLLCAGCGSSQEMTVADARALLPEAASVSKSALDAIVELGARPALEELHSQPLTLVLLVQPMGPGDDTRHLRFKEGGVTPADLIRALREPASGRVSLFDEATITECTVCTENDRAYGTFQFRVDDLYEGEADFEARHTEEGWRITAFEMPDLELRTEVQADGRWRVP
ncbi:MAG: hypothetical protein ACYTG6_03135 [Planctomycetota bacterium]|jgi:hypothetical protein